MKLPAVRVFDFSFLWNLFGWTGRSCLRYAQSLEDHGERTKFGDTELEEVGSYKGCKKEPVCMVKKRACLNSQC